MHLSQLSSLCVCASAAFFHDKMDHDNARDEPCLSDDTSSWHSAFDSPRCPPDEAKPKHGNSICMKKKKKQAKKQRKRRRACSTSSQPKKKHKCFKKSSTTKLTSIDSELHSEPELFMHSVSNAESRAPAPTANEGTNFLRKSKACAKLLVRAGLRCKCHFIHVSHCPSVQFAPVPTPLP